MLIEIKELAPAPIPLPILITSKYIGVINAIAESALGPKPATQTVSIKLFKNPIISVM